MWFESKSSTQLLAQLKCGNIIIQYFNLYYYIYIYIYIYIIKNLNTKLVEARLESQKFKL